MVAPLGGLAASPFSSEAVETTGFAYLDARFAYVWLNECMARINGLPVAAHWGKPIDQVGEGLFKPVMAAIQAMAASGATEWRAERWCGASLPVGGPRCYRITLIPRRSQEGALLGAALLATDITQEKSAEWALAQRFHEQRMWEDLSARFEAGSSRHLVHELRNRLMPMLTVAQMLKKAGGLDPATLEWAGQSMEKKVLELSALVKSLPCDGASSGGDPPPRREPLDFRLLAAQALDPVRPLLLAQRRPSLPRNAVWVLGDPARLLHPVALCLLEVAKQSDGLDINCRAESGLGLLAIVGGAGDSLFRGQEAPPVRSGAESLSSMGLALAKMLVEEQGGSLSVQGAEAGSPGGAIFVRLPLADPPA